MKPYHEILGVPRDADRAAIRTAFRRLAFHCHPDRHPEDAGDAHGRFLELSEAFSAMMDRATTAVATPAAGPPEPEEGGAEALDLDGLELVDEPEEEPAGPDWRRGPPPAPPSVWTLREHRARVRDLARQMALADVLGRRRETAMRVLAALLGLAALGLLGFRALVAPSPISAIGPLLSGLAAVAAGLWSVAFRERRIDRHEPLAEEILRRRGLAVGRPME